MEFAFNCVNDDELKQILKHIEEILSEKHTNYSVKDRLSKFGKYFVGLLAEPFEFFVYLQSLLGCTVS